MQENFGYWDQDFAPLHTKHGKDCFSNFDGDFLVLLDLIFYFDGLLTTNFSLQNLGLIEESKLSRTLPWRPPTNVFRVKEDVRPIFW